VTNTFDWIRATILHGLLDCCEHILSGSRAAVRTTSNGAWTPITSHVRCWNHCALGCHLRFQGKNLHQVFQGQIQRQWEVIDYVRGDKYEEDHASSTKYIHLMPIGSLMGYDDSLWGRHTVSIFFLWWFSEKLTYIFVRIKTDKPKLYISSISSTCCRLEIGVSVTIGYMGTKNIYNISHIARTSITMSIPPQDQFSVLLAGQYAADAKKVKVSNCPKSLADTGVGSPARRSRGNGIASTVLVPNSRVAIQTSGWTILSNEEVKG